MNILFAAQKEQPEFWLPLLRKHLPEDRFFVWTPHPDSLDSRYEVTGWIARDQVLGRARVLF